MINQNGEDNSLNTEKGMYKPEIGTYIAIKESDNTVRFEKVPPPYELMCQKFKPGQIEKPALGGAEQYAAY